jgi:hypothetical protein
MWRVLFLVVFLFVSVGCGNDPVTLEGYGSDDYGGEPFVAPPPEQSAPPSFEGTADDEPLTLVQASFGGSLGKLTGFHFDDAFVWGGSSFRGTNLTVDAVTKNGSAMVQIDSDDGSLFDAAGGQALGTLSAFGCSAPDGDVYEDEIDVVDVDLGDPVTLENGNVTFDIRLSFNFEGQTQLVDASLLFTPGAW